MAKRKFDEFDVSEIKTSDCATIHGVVTELSPVKCSKKDVKYFDGRISDGVKVARLVSFDPNLRGDLEKYKEDGSAVSLANCNVKVCRNGDGLEILASTRSKVTESPKKFKLSDSELVEVKTREVVKLEEIGDVSVDQKVAVRGKIIKVNSPEEVGAKSGKLLKQDCIIADCSAAYRVVLWEKAVDLFEMGKSYELTEALIRMYNCKKYITLTEDGVVKEISDIGEVVQGDCDAGSSHGRVVLGELVGIVSCEEYASCLSCNAKVGKYSDVIGECTKCGMRQKLSKCGKSIAVQFIVEDEKKRKLRVCAFNDVITEMVSGISGECLSDKLLSTPKMKFIINTKDVVSSVELV